MRVDISSESGGRDQPTSCERERAGVEMAALAPRWAECNGAGALGRERRRWGRAWRGEGRARRRWGRAQAVSGCERKGLSEREEGIETDMWVPCDRDLNPHPMCLEPNKKPGRTQPTQPNKKRIHSIQINQGWIQPNPRSPTTNHMLIM